MITLEEVKKESKILGITGFGRFTIAEIEYQNPLNALKSGIVTAKRFVGIGIARQGEGDRGSEEIGRNIAISRAQKALYRKVNGKQINHILMG